MESKKYPIGGYAPGNYSCTCCKCETEFSGDKRAVECEQCAVSAKEKFDALSPEQQQATLGRNVIIANWMFETPLTPERDLILRIVSQWGNTVEMPNMEQWLKDYAAKAQPGPRWVNVSKRLPENDMHMDYPREYCLMCKCDGSRGAVEYKQGNFSEIQDLWQNGPYDVIWWLDERSNSNHSTRSGKGGRCGGVC